jgi:hypothetical protein
MILDASEGNTKSKKILIIRWRQNWKALEFYVFITYALGPDSFLGSIYDQEEVRD